jgi:bis(5'-nucleosidyl)-tetraphosphatase
MYKYEFSAGGILVWNCSILLVHQTATDSWSFPKGHIEGEETELEAAQREILEETGIRNSLLIEKLGTYERPSAKSNIVRKRITMFLFSCELPDTSTEASDVSECRWFSPSDAIAQLSYNEDKGFLSTVLLNAAFARICRKCHE